MHTGITESPKGSVSLFRVVHHTRNDDRGCAVFQEIDLFDQATVDMHQFAQEIVDGPGDTVAFGLPGNKHGVKLQQILDKPGVWLCNGVLMSILEDLRPEHRVVLGKWVIPLDLKAGLAVPRIFILMIILLLLLLLGCVMSALTILLVTIPVFFPVMIALGYDPVWFGVIMILMCNLGTITPPYGINVFVLKGVAKDISLGTMFRGVMPFVGTTMVCLALVIAFPQIATWFPYILKS